MRAGPRRLVSVTTPKGRAHRSVAETRVAEAAPPGGLTMGCYWSLLPGGQGVSHRLNKRDGKAGAGSSPLLGSHLAPVSQMNALLDFFSFVRGLLQNPDPEPEPWTPGREKGSHISLHGPKPPLPWAFPAPGPRRRGTRCPGPTPAGAHAVRDPRGPGPTPARAHAGRGLPPPRQPGAVLCCSAVAFPRDQLVRTV